MIKPVIVYDVKVRENSLKTILLQKQYVMVGAGIVLAGIVFLILYKLGVPMLWRFPIIIIFLILAVVIYNIPIDRQPMHKVMIRFFKYLSRKRNVRF